MSMDHGGIECRRRPEPAGQLPLGSRGAHGWDCSPVPRVQPRGSLILRSTLTQAGQAAGHSKNTYLGATFRRIAARRGRKRAAIAVGRRILEIAYFVLRDGVAYEELGVNYYDERKKAAVVRNAVKRLERLGYRVAIETAA